MMNVPVRRNRLADDSGFSMTELAVYIAVLGIITLVVAASILSLFRSEKTVSSLTNSASQLQVLVSTLNKDLRSAREFAVRDSGQTVVLSVASSTSPITWSCVTWAVAGAESDPDRQIKRNGALILDHVRSNDPDPFFATASGADVPQGKEGTLLYDFRAGTDDSGTVNVEGSVSNEAQGVLGATAHCI